MPPTLPIKEKERNKSHRNIGLHVGKVNEFSGNANSYKFNF